MDFIYKLDCVIPETFIFFKKDTFQMEHMYTCGGFILIFGKTNTIM